MLLVLNSKELSFRFQVCFDSMPIRPDAYLIWLFQFYISFSVTKEEEKSESLLQSLIKFSEDRSIICTQSIENTNIVKYMAK